MVQKDKAVSQDLSESAIAAILEERIQSGVYGPGARLPAERVLAAEFGVSRRFVRLACAQLIEQGLMAKSHYRRPYVAFADSNAAPQAGRDSRDTGDFESGTTLTTLQPISAILPSHPAFPGGLSLVAGIHKVLADVESPYRLTFLDTFHPDRAEVLRIEDRAITTLLKDGASGLIWWYYNSDEAVRDVVRRNPRLPIIFIDRYPQSIDCDFVGIDDVESSRAAVEYLFDLGHVRVAHLMDPGDFSTIVERAEGYRQAHIARGVAYDEKRVVHLDWAGNRTEKAFDTLYGLEAPPTALFTSNDFIAYDFIKYAETRGIRVPDDLSVVGHGNIDRYAARGILTSVDQPFEMIGKTAAKLLLKRLSAPPENQRTYRHVVLQAPLIERGSCRRLDAPGPSDRPFRAGK